MFCTFSSAQPDFKEDARVPSPKRTPNYTAQTYPSSNVSYPTTNVSYRPPESTQPDDSDDSTATHIIEKSDIFHVNGRPKSSIVCGKDTVTISSNNSEPRSELKFTVEIDPVEQVTIKTPPRTPDRSVYTNISQTPSPYRSTTPPRSPRHSHTNESDFTSHTELYERHVSPHSHFTESSVITSESPKRASPIKILPPVEHYPEKHYLVQNVQSETTISSITSVQDSYESTTDNEQYRKPPVRVVKKTKQTSSSEGSRIPKKKHDNGYKYAEKPEKPRDMIVSCFVQLQSSNWEEVMEVRKLYCR